MKPIVAQTSVGTNADTAAPIDGITNGETQAQKAPADCGQVSAQNLDMRSKFNFSNTETTENSFFTVIYAGLIVYGR